MGLGIWDATNVNVSNIRITNIVTPDWNVGSAIFGNPFSYLIIDNLIIENCINNSSNDLVEGVGELTNMTLVNSTSNSSYYLVGWSGTISNSIVWGNTFVANAGGNTTYSYSSIQNSGGSDNWYIEVIDGGDNIDSNPLFCNPDSGDFTLSENSPCVGTGENGVNMGSLGVGCEALILAPVILDIAFDQQIYEDDSLTIVVSATSDINASMTFNATSDTSDVSVTMDSTTLTATPAPDWNGSSLITVIVIDENELSDTTDFTLTVNAVNDAPVANNDTIMVDHNTDYVGQISWSDVDGDMEFSCNLLSNPSNGTATVSVEGSFVYSPTTDYSGSDSFTFTVCDNSLCDTATVLITIHSLSLDETSLPTEFALRQNYPNPFNPVTTLRYDIPENSHVTITIYDMLGRQVKTLINQTQDAGYKSLIWDATNDYGKPVSAGIYLYQIQAGEYISTKKMVLLK